MSGNIIYVDFRYKRKKINFIKFYIIYNIPIISLLITKIYHINSRLIKIGSPIKRFNNIINSYIIKKKVR